MGWLKSFIDDFKMSIKKEWNDKPMSNTTTEQTTTQSPSSVVTVASAPAATEQQQAYVPTSVNIPSVSQPAQSTNVIQRTLHAISADYETAITDLESFVTSKEKYIESYIADELAKLKAAAEADYLKIATEKQKLVTSLETELTTVKNFLTSKFHSVISALHL